MSADLYVELIERLATSFEEHTAKRDAPTQIFVTTHSPYFVGAPRPSKSRDRGAGALSSEP